MKTTPLFIGDENGLRDVEPTRTPRKTQDIRPNAWGRSVRTRRVFHGFSQEDLAKRLGVNQVMVSRYETGKSVPSQERRQEIEKFFEDLA